MPEQKRTLNFGGRETPVTEVEIVSRGQESPVEYALEDGSVIRITNPAVVIYRLEDGSLDGEGNPVYVVKLGTNVTTVRSHKKVGKPLN